MSWQDGEGLLDDWRNRALAAQTAHYAVASRLRSLNRVPVLVSVFLAIGLGVVLVFFPPPDSLLLRVGVGLTTAAIAISTAMVALLSFEARADQHVVAADWYASIRRKIEQLQAAPPKTRGDPKQVIYSLKEEFNKAGSQSPEIGEKVWKRISARFGLRPT